MTGHGALSVPEGTAGLLGLGAQPLGPGAAPQARLHDHVSGYSFRQSAAGYYM